MSTHSLMWYSRMVLCEEAWSTHVRAHSPESTEKSLPNPDHLPFMARPIGLMRSCGVPWWPTPR